jgi:hypothetical protein
MADVRTSTPPIPESRVVARKRTRISVVWVIPIIAAVVGAWVAISRIESEGPKIQIVSDRPKDLTRARPGSNTRASKSARLRPSG